MSESIRAACIQMCSGHDIENNLANAAIYLNQAAEKKVKLILLPENFSFIAQNNAAKLNNAKKNTSILKFLSEQAKQHGMWIIAGSTLCPCDDNKKLHNRCNIFSPDGKHQTQYDKIHLFNAELETESWCESESIEAGAEPIMVSIDDDWKAGISICYDLRFPELYRHYSVHHCNILTVASAFTVPTGKAHWETLLRARAIENQSYILAAAQYGIHSDGRTTYGHSMMIDPWGKVIAELPSGEGIITAELSLKYLQHIRHSLPVLQHRKNIK